MTDPEFIDGFAVVERNGIHTLKDCEGETWGTFYREDNVIVVAECLRRIYRLGLAKGRADLKSRTRREIEVALAAPSIGEMSRIGLALDVVKDIVGYAKGQEDVNPDA